MKKLLIVLIVLTIGINHFFYEEVFCTDGGYWNQFDQPLIRDRDNITGTLYNQQGNSDALVCDDRALDTLQLIILAMTLLFIHSGSTDSSNEKSI